ncbi:carboxymuconolactone decarboxylase family protein [Nocardioides jishulii]|uniref:Carboxymuconolactone decarboxylase family protein n=1 Tax=Nocardioides jishulii TaxID=2575440 RepID=A0A4U2YR28_9ACTN|nr:hypothetical protein [Nocardioides jishulii]QCX26377.1 hypothetical protein FCL41_01580 [Nocardioides jishulii]TKI63818.1 hypothetical protein FC770_01125 [Nocardioides jishulii]
MTFLSEPVDGPAVQTLYAADVADDGYVMNLTHLWAHDPPTNEALTSLLVHTAEVARLTPADRGVLICATAAALGDSYCALAWGGRLSRLADEATALAVLRGELDDLPQRVRTLAQWADAVVRNPAATQATDVDALRTVGFDDRQVFALTTYVALRLAFSSVNASLGATPDPQLRDDAPPAVAETVTWGRGVED